jgi:hypothetical protein
VFYFSSILIRCRSLEQRSFGPRVVLNGEK